MSAEPVRLLWERMEARGLAHGQDGKRFFAVSFFELADGRIARGVEYWSDGEPASAPEWRARWMEPL